MPGCLSNKKNKNTIILYSSSHADNLVATNETKKIVMILDYNKKKENWTCIVMQEASDAHSKTADSDTVLTYQVSSVQLVTDKKLEAFNN